jgi:hypothetical protein
MTDDKLSESGESQVEPPTANCQLPTANRQPLTLQLVSGTGVIRSASLLTGEFTRELISHICISSEG